MCEFECLNYLLVDTFISLCSRIFFFIDCSKQLCNAIRTVLRLLFDFRFFERVKLIWHLIISCNKINLVPLISIKMYEIKLNGKCFNCSFMKSNEEIL